MLSSFTNLLVCTNSAHFSNVQSQMISEFPFSRFCYFGDTITQMSHCCCRASSQPFFYPPMLSFQLAPLLAERKAEPASKISRFRRLSSGFSPLAQQFPTLRINENISFLFYKYYTSRFIRSSMDIS